MTRLRPVLALALAGALTAAVSAGTPAAAAPPTPAPSTQSTHAPPAPPAPAVTDGRITDPATALGRSYRSSGDVLVTGVGDEDGFHVYVARERDAFGWSMLATLTLPGLDSGPWTGYTCVTGSGRYAAVVYAPSTAVNSPALLRAGALAAVVDLRSGAVRGVTAGVALEYSSPACGAGDDVLLTRSPDEDGRHTDLLWVDAARARVTATAHEATQVTTPAPVADGAYAVAGRRLVHIGRDGALRAVATPGGTPFALHAAGSGAIDVLTVTGTRTVAERWSGGRLARLGDAPVGRLDLFGRRGDGDVLVGDVRGLSAAAGQVLSTPDSAPRPLAVSADGHLVALELLPRSLSARTGRGGGTGAGAPARLGQLHVRVLAPRSGRQVSTDVLVPRATASAPLAAQAPGGAAPHQAGGNRSVPTCSVPRNDPTRQVLQPTAAMVEWAADQAVHGRLTVSRPAGYLHAGEPAYDPQGMFPLPALAGGGTVPVQVLLGILAQETNFRQATFHARPGDGGNPFVADYYGTGGSIEQYDFAAADCGYGIAQVTDGMRAADTTRTPAQQVAIATDYAANIAAALQVLVGKWNEIAAAGLTFGQGGSRYVENWFVAAWAYNSGFHEPTTEGSPWGIGWLNNPANPRYPADRMPFLRDSPDDAARPADWPYEEKVMGWAETPQRTYGDTPSYAAPVFGTAAGGRLSLPASLATFCQPDVNHCDTGALPGGDPCPSESDACWWNRSTAWVGSCATLCATESLTHPLDSAEPAMVPQYTPDCAQPPVGTFVVDDLADGSRNVVGCPGAPEGGKFALRTGDNLDSATDAAASSVNAQIDLHQLGAAYQGHLFFTHVYDSDPGDHAKHLVSGTWTPDPGRIPAVGQKYRIAVHLPDHGGEFAAARYKIDTGTGSFGTAVTLDQDTAGANEWVPLTSITLRPGARIQLRNDLGGDGSVDLAFDAIMFTPVSSALATRAAHPGAGSHGGGTGGGLPPAAPRGAGRRAQANRDRSRRRTERHHPPRA